MKWFDQLTSDPKSLFKTYIIGSFAILLVTLSLIALTLSLMFAGRERERSNLVLEQIEKTIEYQYRAIAEEMWTGSYEAIAFRFKDIAKLHSSPYYAVKLTDPKGRCFYSAAADQVTSSNCQLSEEQNRFIAKQALSEASRIESRANDATDRYEYMAPLFVGTTLKGFVFSSFADPYRFFRGTPLLLITWFFSPALLLVLCVWMTWLYASNRLLLKPYLGRILASRQREALGDLATKVAHDIRSPLTALTMASRDLPEVSRDKRELIEKASGRINEIANDLLTQYRSQYRDPVRRSEPELTAHNIAELLKEIFGEKQILLKDRHEIRMELDLKGPIDAESALDRVEFVRVLSNLVNNAIEAIEGAGHIKLALRSSLKDVAIIISDDGKGITEEILCQLGARPITHGKESSQGSGIGFFSAKKSIERINGQLSIQSRVGVGTIVTIRLPRANSRPNHIPRS